MRDLEADLAICEAATPGPWETRPNLPYSIDGEVVFRGRGDENRTLLRMQNKYPDHAVNIRFVTEARTGWPEAIRRALAAEERVDKLEHELRMLHDVINSNKA